MLTRAAFLEVLMKILQQGTEGFNTLGDSVSAERFESLVELVTMMGDNGELPIANALANVVHTNYLVSFYYKQCVHYTSSLPLLYLPQSTSL